jgi:hypothetical protein
MALSRRPGVQRKLYVGRRRVAGSTEKAANCHSGWQPRKQLLSGWQPPKQLLSG